MQEADISSGSMAGRSEGVEGWLAAYNEIKQKVGQESFQPDLESLSLAAIDCNYLCDLLLSMCLCKELKGAKPYFVIFNKEIQLRFLF